uniref:cAMP regulated phosphoprotein 19 n=1 Tax=Amphiprion ocellaris TaxID=80972 RepID=A0A3Q1BWV7_AMPOC
IPAQSSRSSLQEQEKHSESAVLLQGCPFPHMALLEEAKLKARYPNLGAKPGGSDFLRKRLQKRQKYFDSGDYNMTKAKMKNNQLPSAPAKKTEIRRDHIPTPQDLPQRKTSIVASKLPG